MPDPAWRQPPAQYAAKPRLSQELIVDAALDIARAEGFAAVSMRRIAQALGTGPASLYAHVADKDQLGELMLDRILLDVPLPSPDPAHWMQQTRQLLRAQLHAMLAYPGVATVAWNILVPVGPNTLRHAEALLCLLRAGGLTLKQAAYTGDALTIYTKAFACEATAGMSGTLDRADITRRGNQMHQYMTSVPPDTFANLLQLGDAYSADTADERFEFALDTLLRGLAALKRQT
jgi:AcrR family transcriptional regulator